MKQPTYVTLALIASLGTLGVGPLQTPIKTVQPLEEVVVHDTVSWSVHGSTNLKPTWSSRIAGGLHLRSAEFLLELSDPFGVCAHIAFADP